jgi:DcuC family C4-dicarboxylate transporter
MSPLVADVVALLVVVATFTFIIRGAEVRLALLAGGAVLAALSLNPAAWFDAFARAMTQAGLITVILPAIGFTAVIKLAGCDQELVRLVVRPLLHLRGLIIPVSMLATVLLSTAITSAAGVTAAVGVVLIPAMIALGVHPAMAAAAVFAGTWGGSFSPGSPHGALISKISGVPVIEVIVGHLPGSVPAALTVATVLYLIAKLRREDAGWTPERAGAKPEIAPTLAVGEDQRVNLAKAAMPILPLALLLLTVPQFGLTSAWLPKGLSVLQAMVIGTVLTALVGRLKPSEVSKKFFEGMGESYGSVMGIIIAAGVFVGGLSAIGAIDSLIKLLSEVQGAAPVAAMFGTFGIAVLSGSGDAAALAFNEAVLPHAADLGMNQTDLGSIAWIGGGLGRSMSPVAAACAIAAGYAGVSVFDVAKRNAVPMLAGAVVAVVILGFLI